MSTYSIGQMNQLANALKEKGFTPEEVTRLGQSPKVLGEIRQLINGFGRVEIVCPEIDCDASPFCPEDWWIDEADQLPGRVSGSFKWDPQRVGLYLDPAQRNGGKVGGPELAKALANEPVLPANVLDYLLKYPVLIPDVWKMDGVGRIRHIYFWGTFYRNRHDHPRVRGMNYMGCGKWRWFWSTMHDNWHDDDWAARLLSSDA